ncbi:hypothetical protein [Rhodococcus sp. UNC363MFTsu5.1]|uniref:hypothetical protein n=1 Tax=Rhodococcus sp. UNC363MFTsu5.1 TaxID=1449069 RepID=UPI000489FD31|nr:hypothetical protein [Rhodococcus sp. UNC363MFTsu5.1]
MTLTADDCIAAATTPHSRYLEHAQAALDACIRGAVPFSADTVRALIPASAGEGNPNVLPALFLNASKRQRITPVGYIAPARHTRHGNRNRLWIGGPQ